MKRKFLLRAAAAPVATVLIFFEAKLQRYYGLINTPESSSPLMRSYTHNRIQEIISDLALQAGLQYDSFEAN